MAAANGLGAAEPFVLTLEMDGASFARLNGLRKQYTYPPERNAVPAHVTLFHQLPGDHAREIKAILRNVALRHQVIEIEVGEAKNLGNGVAIPLRAPRLHALREALAAEWQPWLVAQDLAGFRPHVTIQNKVGAAEARRALAEIGAALLPFTMRGIGLHLWRYRGGPWDDVQLYRFR